jgi:tetratricopeptide (TPR) repeat protein
MSLFDGMYAYEVVLLILGVLLFLLLAGLLVALVVRGKAFSGLLFFFAIPIAMIGYPSIQKITFQDGAVTIEKTTAQLQAAPTDTALRSNLEKQVSSLASRPTTDPAALTNIAKAQFALGNQAVAETTLQKALQKAPTLPQAMALKQRIEIDRGLSTLTSQLAQHPGDAAVRQQLANTVAQSASLKIASPVFLGHVAMAHAALGDKARSQSFAETALKINPNLAEANQLKSLAAPLSPPRPPFAR